MEAFYPNFNPAAIIAADNAICPGAATLQQCLAPIRSKPDVESVLLPVGTGLELSRYKPH